MSGNRKRPASSQISFELHYDSKDQASTGLAPRSTRIRHTGYDLDVSGSQPSSNNTYIVAPASPEKALDSGPLLLDDLNTDNLPQLEEVADSDDGEYAPSEAMLDTEYQRHVVDLAEELREGHLPRRKRTTEVRYHCHIIETFLTV